MSATRLAKLESAIRVAAAYLEFFNRRDLAGMGSLLAEGCTLEAAVERGGQALRGKAAILGYWESIFHERPGARAEAEEILGLGARAVLRWRLVWTDDVGASRDARGVDILTVKAELIVEELSYIKERRS